MNPIFANLCVFVVLGTMYLSWILLPLVNLNIISNSEAYMQESVQSLLDEQRLHPENLVNDIEQIQLNNIEIESVELADLPDYLVYTINYKYKWIFSNKFLSSNQANNMIKSKTYILDRV